jgi:NAD kinase
VTTDRKVVLVTRRTRLEDLISRFHTVDQARFYLEHLGADFGDYEREHGNYLAAKKAVAEALVAHGRWQAIERQYLPSFLFGPGDVVVALGQDGLVANTMKYLDGHPLVGINPDPARFDGVLLPFRPNDLALLLRDVLHDRRPDRRVTMAEAALPDGQRLLAVNDVFIGPRSHTSARYEIAWAGQQETQSSSGVIVSTGLGSTGWMTSVVVGSLNIGAAWAHRAAQAAYEPLPWDSARLRFAVREPFPSRTTKTDLVFGEFGADAPLRLTSLMAEPGVIFSDGIEADFVPFGAGATVTIAPAQRVGRLVV